MLRLIIGTDWTANRNEILRHISQDVAQGLHNRILMVPELISHDMERRLCEAAGDTTSRFAEVLSFTRLANRVSEYIQDPGLECLDNGGRLVAMAAATGSLHSKLKAYASVETKPEFLISLVDAVDEFKRCRISAADLKTAANQTQGSLAQKLEELSLILDAYDGVCAHGKRDPRDRETQFLEQLEDCDFAEKHTFYIDGFPDFTRQHMAILAHLISYSPSVTISINCDQVSSEKVAFEKTGSTAFELIKCAKDLGVEYEIVEIQGSQDPLKAIARKIFQGDIDTEDTVRNRIHVRYAESVFQECTDTAEQIIALVQQGCRYRDISIVCGDVATYQDALSMVFHRCGIPLYRSGTDSVLEMNVISAVLCALDVALCGFDQQDMLRYMRSILSGLDTDLCDKVENYAIIWGIRGLKWYTPWENHPDGLGEQWTESSLNRLSALENARKKLVAPLQQLQKDFRNAKDLAGQVKALYSFLENIQLSRRLSQLAQRMDEENDHRSAQILNQIWEILLSALEQLHDVLGTTHWEDQNFTRLLTLLLSQYDVGTIPPVLDAVMFGPVSAMRCQEPKHLFVLGAEEGAIPGYGGAAGVFNDQERETLRKLGVPLTGGAMEGIQAEFAEIYGVFCGAQKTVHISSASGQPSFILRRLETMAGGSAHADGFYGSALTDPQDAGAFLLRYSGENDAEALGVSEEYQWALRRKNHNIGNISREGIRNIYGTVLNLSASQVDRQGECRLSYFLRYGLRLKERKELTIDPAEFGTYVHAVLEETGRAVMELGGFHQVSLEKTMELAKSFSDAYAQERFRTLDSERLTYLFRRNGQELELVLQELWQELSTCRFEPVDFETAFGDQGQMPAIPISGSTMEAKLRGFVDRVDAWKENGQNYFRVVDYKTGRKDFDYCDVFNGIGLQMLLYLFALEQGGDAVLGSDPISAGVQYFPARVPLVSADGRVTDAEAQQLHQKEWKRKGLLLHDEQVLRAMEPEDAPNRICASFKKDGSITGDLADREQLKLLRKYVFLVLGRLVDDIASGNVEPNPYTRGTTHDACAYCPYSSVCHSESVEGRRNYKTMDAQRFWDEISKEVNPSGR